MADTHSWFGWRAISATTFDRRRARATRGDPPRQPDPPYFPPAPYADAAAGLYSSTPDMVRWLSYSMGLSGTPALNAARPYLYDTPSLIRPRDDAGNPRKKVGLAWNIQVHGHGRTSTTCIAKYGLTRGFTAYIVFVKHHRLGAFVLLNSEPDSPDTPTIGTRLINTLPWGSRSQRHRTVCDVALSGGS
jgi:CubicO group peptidase (beta-lactamase class C family)